MPRLNLEKMSFAELSKLRLQVDRLMIEKQASEKSALRQKMANMYFSDAFLRFRRKRCR